MPGWSKAVGTIISGDIPGSTEIKQVHPGCVGTFGTLACIDNYLDK